MTTSQRTGIRFILVALVLAAITSVAFEIITLVPADSYLTNPGTSLTFHLVILPLASIGLLVCFTMIGAAGILLLEGSRGRRVGAARTFLDRIRIAFLAAAVGGAFTFVSGIILGFVYVSDVLRWESLRLLAILGTVVAIGLVLFWSARRMDAAAGPLATLALATGVLSAALGVGGTLLWLAGEGIVTGAPMAAVLQAVGLVVFPSGLGSLILWILVYVRIARGVPRAPRTASASEAGLTL